MEEQICQGEKMQGTANMNRDHTKVKWNSMHSQRRIQIIIWLTEYYDNGKIENRR